MIYLDNNSTVQSIYLPRSSVRTDASPEYATKTELENAIENEVIRADGKYATKEELIQYATTGWVESQDYVNSEEMASAITDAITSETARTEETYQKISEMSAYSTTNEVEIMIDDAVSGKMDTSAMSAYSTTEQMNQAIDDSASITTGWVASQGYLTGFTETDPIFTGSPAYGITSQNITDWNSVSGKADASKFNDYTPSSGFSTINGSAITSGEAIVIETGGNYSAGTNIQIEDNVISVTGITVPTKLSDLDNDEGFITSGDIPTSNTAFTNDAGYITTADTQDFVTSGDVKTQIEGYGYITENALSGYSTTEEMNQAIDDAVSGKMDTDAMSAYSTTQEMNTAIDNAVSGKMDTSGMTAYATTAFTEETYLKEHQSLAGLFASVDYVSSAKTIYFYDKDETQVGTIDATDFIKDGMVDSVYISGDTLYIVFNSDAGKETIEIPLSDIFDPSNYYTKDEVDSAITAATDGLASEVYVDNSVSGKADTTALTQYYTSAQTDTAISNAVSGLASTQYVDNSVSGKADTSEFSAYTPTSGFSTINGSAITEGGNITVEETPYSGGTNIQIEDHVISVTGITIPTKVSDLENDEGFITNEALSGLASETYVDNAVSGKADTSAVTADITAATAATTGWVENQGYLTAFTETDPVFTGSPAYGITAQDIANWNAATGGSAYSAGQNINIDANNEISVTGITSYTGITSGDVTTALGYTPISGVDLTDYYTSAQTDTQISNATSGKQDTLVSGTNIKTINNESILGSGNIVISGGGDMSQYWTSAETQSAITNSVSGKADTSAVTAAISAATADMVTGDRLSGVIHIEVLDQQSYDNLVGLGEIDPNTLYIII